MKNVLFNNMVIDASVELVPRIPISPFVRMDIFCGDVIKQKKLFDDYFRSRFGRYLIFPKARAAISAVLKTVNLKEKDIVTIFTTSGNKYISGCVTGEIEKYCKWSRVIEKDTKILFINHEFGYPVQHNDYEKIVELKRNNKDLIVVEDCAHTFFSRNSDIGRVADYIIYSLPKSFSLQIGAILVPKNQLKLECDIDELKEMYIVNKMSNYIPKIEEFISKQINNYMYLKNNLKNIGIYPYFENYCIGCDSCVPSVFLFRWHDNIDYDYLKVFMQRNGVESSVFYGENAFYVPCNYNLTQNELDYIISLLNYYSEYGKRKAL